MTRRSRPASWSGLSGITVTIVVQLGQATIPWCSRSAWALISGTTSGTAGSMRYALDLSTTTAPALTARGACSLDCAEPAEKKATSTPWKASGPSVSTRMLSPLNVTALPTERSEAKTRSAFTGNLRSSSILSVVCPTAPVTPTIATVTSEAIASTFSRVSRVGLLDSGGDQIAHLPRADELHPHRVNVARPVSLLEHAQHGRVDPVGVGALVERVAQQHGRREYGRDRVGHALARDVRRRPVDRLVETPAATKARRRQHAHGAGQDGGLVGQDVAEGVLGHDGVEVRRLVHERHRAVVHEHVLELHLGIVLRHARDHLAPQLRHYEHIGLVHGGQPLLALHGDVESGAGDPLDLPGCIGHGIHGPGPAVGELLPPPGLTEVEPAREFTDDHDVRALDHRALERRGVHQHGEAPGGSQVGEEVELLADTQEAPLGLLLLRQVIPLGPADRAEEDGIALLAEPERRGRQRFAGGVDGRPTDEGLLELERDARGLADHLEDPAALGRHFLPDAVAAQKRDLVRRHYWVTTRGRSLSLWTSA